QMSILRQSRWSGRRPMPDGRGFPETSDLPSSVASCMVWYRGEPHPVFGQPPLTPAAMTDEPERSGNILCSTSQDAEGSLKKCWWSSSDVTQQLFTEPPKRSEKWQQWIAINRKYGT